MGVPRDSRGRGGPKEARARAVQLTARAPEFPPLVFKDGGKKSKKRES